MAGLESGVIAPAPYGIWIGFDVGGISYKLDINVVTGNQTGSGGRKLDVDLVQPRQCRSQARKSNRPLIASLAVFIVIKIDGEVARIVQIRPTQRTRRAYVLRR